MLTAIKTFLQNLNSKSITTYYQSRCEQAKTALELEAIIYTQSLLSLYDWRDSNNDKANK
ncbi:hypothetical protein [Vibrio comitans]|uniref:Uncharacterized protein n=1 Tax=Vibrio comitans NBRC 102076 TaxID=1219078 RepID=A0A4Y3ISB8_9VIBR|nr:hypothetical protein [Vibrio comitans]GEA61935.1 hypothetical protein VCO01S_31280 [Vibrio comitans NBRC 102076]